MLAKLSKQLFDEINQSISKHSEGESAQRHSVLPQKELQALLESALKRLNLVTREEFDAQTSVLLRTREKLDILEKELAQLQELLLDRTEK